MAWGLLNLSPELHTTAFHPWGTALSLRAGSPGHGRSPCHVPLGPPGRTGSGHPVEPVGTQVRAMLRKTSLPPVLRGLAFHFLSQERKLPWDRTSALDTWPWAPDHRPEIPLPMQSLLQGRKCVRGTHATLNKSSLVGWNSCICSSWSPVPSSTSKLTGVSPFV